MNKLNELIDEINDLILSLSDEKLDNIISKFESHTESDDTWEAYSRLAMTYVEPDQVSSRVSDLLESDDDDVQDFYGSIGDVKSLTDFYLKHGVLSNCSDSQIAFCRLIDKLGY